ncbi:P-loop containing nucleoside triphosphate hydrolase [Cinara cedri]|uniref:P-loop containing nucleoside triphosphate hydrolase n=1 Tax=Cinara cedri TaxID=506608 RepID=A0A5E4MLP9_9HEMI|nr:P-loop containing nucleoside triphosphate hydrolase [Cinara cedri]VVC32309.1 P-loop containing nucleoside triphosphate hydrolase [Cinara cedri]
MSKKLIVVIAGITCGGKTSIANNLPKFFSNISILHQDDFYYTDLNKLESIPELNYYAFDKINAYDMDKMMISINSQISDILVLEGILLLDDIRIVKLVDLKFFIVMDKNNSWNRRKARTYLPPEPTDYFNNYVWPEYEKHLAKIEIENQDVIFLNGSNSIDFNTTVVVNHIKQFLLNLK